MVLEHHGAIRPRFVDLGAVQHHAAAARPQQARDDIQHRRFAAAGVADQGNEFTLGNHQVDVVQRREGPAGGGKFHGYMVDIEMFNGHCSLR